MRKECVINIDLVDIWREPGRKDLLRTLAWGDAVTVIEETATFLKVEIEWFREEADGSLTPIPDVGYIEPSKSSRIKPSGIVRPLQDNVVLKVNFVDVQQGDGAIIESPDGKVILVDGGDNRMFARYLAGRFRRTSKQAPREIDCILVTHGDADHFAALPYILESETHKEAHKRLFIEPRRYFHNGLIKRPAEAKGKSVADEALLGAVQKAGGKTFIVGLEDSLLDIPDSEMNASFREWKAVLKEYDSRSRSAGKGGIEFRRLQFGDAAAFDFFSGNGLRVEVLGPLVEDAGGRPGLRFLGAPRAGARLNGDALGTGTEDFAGLSAKHTINGHSVVIRLVYGGFSYLFAGDLNDESGRALVREHRKGTLTLRSEVFKVPHHGSADFSGALLEAVAPVVSVVSSGDESARKDYIHPRATLIGALGKHSRIPEPLVFVTEMVAFMKIEGPSRLVDPKKADERGKFFAFSRAAFGMVKTRTDGKRLLVYTDSAKKGEHEEYAFTLDAAGEPTPARVVHA